MLDIADNNYDSFMSNDKCMCGFNNSQIFPGTLLYGSSYVPHQYMNKVYDAENGLKIGTIFPELNNPYCPGQSQEIFNYLQKTNNNEGGCM